jgi:hypothetical protein
MNAAEGLVADSAAVILCSTENRLFAVGLCMPVWM